MSCHCFSAAHFIVIYQYFTAVLRHSLVCQFWMVVDAGGRRWWWGGGAKKGGGALK